jgi:hypothetical protein
VREDGKQWVEKGSSKKYITERNGRSSWERQGIVFCTCLWNEEFNLNITDLLVNFHFNCKSSLIQNRCYSSLGIMRAIIPCSIKKSLDFIKASSLHSTGQVSNYQIFPIIRQYLYWPKFWQVVYCSCSYMWGCMTN